MGDGEVKLVVVICEAILEKEIIEISKKLGAQGYTVLQASGGGSHSYRGASFEFDKNIKIEILCKNETAEALCKALRDHFFEDYSIVIYLTNVHVFRSEKFA